MVTVWGPVATKPWALQARLVSLACSALRVAVVAEPSGKPWEAEPMAEEQAQQVPTAQQVHCIRHRHSGHMLLEHKRPGRMDSFARTVSSHSHATDGHVSTRHRPRSIAG